MTVRVLAKLAQVSPDTAARVTSELVRSGRAELVPPREDRFARVALKPVLGPPPRRVQRTKAGQLRYLARLGPPVWVVTSDMLRERGLTRGVAPFVALPRSWRGVVDLPVPVAFFRRPRPLELAHERLTDSELFVALLKVRPNTARALLALNKDTLDRMDWIRLVTAEGMRRQAARAGFVVSRRKRSAP